MITILSNLVALIPINHAFIIQKDYVRGNLYVILMFASTVRHSIIETHTPRKELYSEILDKGMIYIICSYNVYKKWALIFPYMFMFLLHRYYLTPRYDKRTLRDNYTISDKLVHAIGLHLVGALVALRV